MGETTPEISVIIPHLNQHQALKECLRVLAQQSFPQERFEVIVVDNGSSEAPNLIVSSFDNVRLEQEPTPGPGPARNKGIAVSRGRILAFIDADCFADRNWLSSIAARLQNDNRDAQVLGGDVRIALKDPNRLTMLEAYESVFAYRQREYIEKMGFSGTGNLAMLRGVFETVGPFAGIEVAEDRDWGRRAADKGRRAAYVPEMIVYHPARHSLAEMYEKWDRHIEHDFEEWRLSNHSRISWILRAFFVALSPAVDLFRILRSPRVSGAETRRMAFYGLVAVRRYRAARMLNVALRSDQADAPTFWNRSA